MNKNYLFKLSLFLIPITAIVLMSSNAGQNGAFSGSPGDGGNTCTACHAGGNFNASVDITTNIPSTGYELNTDYTVMVTVNETGASRHGFAFTAERDSDNSKVGTLIAGTNTRLVNSNGNITQSNADAGNSWTFTWRSPATEEGTISFYASGNAANGNGSTSGDQIVTTSISESSLSASDESLLDFEMFPNPAADVVNIQLPSGIVEAKAGVFDYTGRLVHSKTITLADTQLDVTNLASGIYIIRVVTENKLGAQRFIKR